MLDYCFHRKHILFFNMIFFVISPILVTFVSVCYCMHFSMHGESSSKLLTLSMLQFYIFSYILITSPSFAEIYKLLYSVHYTTRFCLCSLEIKLLHPLMLVHAAQIHRVNFLCNSIIMDLPSNLCS